MNGYQIRRIPYTSNSDSIETTGRSWARGLGDQHAVERVAVEIGEPAGTFSVRNCDGELQEALILEAGLDILRPPRPLRATCQGGVLVVISQADAALTRMTFSGSATAIRAVSDSLSLPASHHRNACVSRRNPQGASGLPRRQLGLREGIEEAVVNDEPTPQGTEASSALFRSCER